MKAGKISRLVEKPGFGLAAFVFTMASILAPAASRPAKVSRDIAVPLVGAMLVQDVRRIAGKRKHSKGGPPPAP
jgi:hypothetical protein